MAKTKTKAPALEVTTEEAVAVLTALGFSKAKSWSEDKLVEMLNQVNTVEDAEDLLADADESVTSVYEAVNETLADGDTVGINDEATSDDEDESEEEPEEDDDSEDDETDDEEDEEPAPKKKSKAKPEPKKPAKPEKKSAKPDKPAKKGDKKPEKKSSDRAAPGTVDVLPLPAYKPGVTDVWGSRYDTRTSRVNMAILFGKPMNGKEIQEKTNESGIGSHLSRLQRNGKIEREDGKYVLTKQGEKDKIKQQADMPGKKKGKPVDKDEPKVKKPAAKEVEKPKAKVKVKVKSKK